MELYIETANVVKHVLSKKDSLKSLVFSSKIQNKKALFKLSCESLKYRKVLEEILEKCGQLKQDKFLARTPHLGTVLLYEHALGRGIKGKYAVQFKRHQFAIHTQCELMKIRAGVTDIRQLVDTEATEQASSLPKYVRLNTLLAPAAATRQQFVDTYGYEQVNCDHDSFRDIVSRLAGKRFTTDPDIPDLLVFPPSTDFHDMLPYKKGHIIVQDKASCFPAHILSPEAGTSVIDCCAAPGNKTSHLASILGNNGTVYAFDKSQKRLATLQKQMRRAGATCVKAECRDFLTVQPGDTQYRDVQYILVDPSCSGSGMVNRVLQHTDEGDAYSPERLAQLAKFQTSILNHALSFPHVKRVVYSTCSVHVQENEGVVEEVLSTHRDRFKLRLIMPEWPYRGLQSSPVGKYCVRMTHDQALTNGFFVACFESCDANTRTSDDNLAEKIGLDNDCSDKKCSDMNMKSSEKKCSDQAKVGVCVNGSVENHVTVHKKGKETGDKDVQIAKRLKKKKKKTNACKKKRKKNKEHKQ